MAFHKSALKRVVRAGFVSLEQNDLYSALRMLYVMLIHIALSPLFTTPYGMAYNPDLVPMHQFAVAVVTSLVSHVNYLAPHSPLRRACANLAYAVLASASMAMTKVLPRVFQLGETHTVASTGYLGMALLLLSTYGEREEREKAVKVGRDKSEGLHGRNDALVHGLAGLMGVISLARGQEGSDLVSGTRRETRQMMNNQTRISAKALSELAYSLRIAPDCATWVVAQAETAFILGDVPKGIRILIDALASPDLAFARTLPVRCALLELLLLHGSETGLSAQEHERELLIQSLHIVDIDPFNARALSVITPVSQHDLDIWARFLPVTTPRVRRIKLALDLVERGGHLPQFSHWAWVRSIVDSEPSGYDKAYAMATSTPVRARIWSSLLALHLTQDPAATPFSIDAYQFFATLRDVGMAKEHITDPSV